MIVHVMVNVTHVMVYVLFIWCMFSFVCTICESILEVDCVVDEPNTFEDDP
jgi:hypothetical protein